MTVSYVVGFAFDGGGNVALVRKARPDWQKGRLNGIGGHIEVLEPSHAAMVREFEEETGVTIPEWDLYATLQGKDWECYFFRAFEVDFTFLKTTTDEEILVCPVNPLPEDVLPNLQWLIPLALDPEGFGTEVKYRE